MESSKTMEEAVAPIVEQVLQEGEAAAMPTEASGTPATSAEGAATSGETATAAGDAAAADQPAPETAVEAADADGATKPAAEAAAKPAAAAAVKEDTTDTPTKKPKRKETRKRVRRVGKAEPRKVPKIDPPAVAAAAGGEAAADAARPEGAPIPSRRVLSKHDEKWNNMFDRLLEYKKANTHTLVPQCYHDDPRLGRWVHYQRVEYWIYQQSGTGKITPERIGRLEAIGFEWDPQKAQWNIMFDRLVKYKEEVGHCKVPKGYSKDTELANWVRNQRLEQANQKKGKKSRMTEERYNKLTDLGFRWSTSIAKKGTSTRKTASTPTAASEDPPAAAKEDATTKAVEEAVAVAIEMGDGGTETAAAAGESGETAVKAEQGAVIQI